MELDFDKYCVVDGSPTTVLPAVCHSKVPNGNSKGKPKHGNHMLSGNGDFTAIRFDGYRSVSCKDTRSRRSNQEDTKMLKRGSAYQSSEEGMQLKRSDATPQRKKIEVSGGSETMSSFGIIDSLCNSDEDTLPMDQDRFSEIYGSEQSTSNFCNEIHSQGSMNNPFHPILQRVGQQKRTSLDERDEQSTVHQYVQEDLRVTSESTFGGNSSHRRNRAANLHKSLSAKLALPQSPVQSKIDGTKSSSLDFQFRPGQKIFGPFDRSKTCKSPLGHVSEAGSETRSGHVVSNGYEELNKSMLNVSLDKQHHTGYNSLCEKKENRKSGPLCSPAYLHGLLKMKTRRGIPVFKFSVKSPEDIYVARTWKVDNTLDWIYTFHSVSRRKNSKAIGWKFKDSHRDSSMVGQMLVSCYLSTELKVGGASSDSMVTEFVMYDIAHLRKSNSSKNNSCRSDACKAAVASDKTLSQSSSEQNKISTMTKNKVHIEHSCDSGELEASASLPLAAAKLHQGLEIAAIIVQVPLEKRESLKLKSGDKKIDTPHPILLDLCHLEHTNGAISDTPGKMHVLIPAGHHSLPSTESRGPSPLLDRWRLGGGCDCGGWDLACPLTVFSNPNFHVVKGKSLVDDQHLPELFHEGTKDGAQAFGMRAVEEGLYTVDFHARLSSLQAFSICVALLHAAEASATLGHGRSLQSDSRRVFVEKEIERFTETIVKEHNLKPNKTMEGVMPSFIVNPSFSPLARV